MSNSRSRIIQSQDRNPRILTPNRELLTPVSPPPSPEIALRIAADPDNGMVWIDFGRTVQAVAFTPDQLVPIMETLLEKMNLLKSLKSSTPEPTEVVPDGENDGKTAIET